MATIQNLQLYMRDHCGFCAMVMKEIKRLDIVVEYKNIWNDDAANQNLMEKTGRSVVPVLYYENEKGESHYLPESIEIIFFLRKHFVNDLKA